MDKHHPAPAHPLSRVTIIGDADHGLWSAGSGTITTNHAVELSLRGAAPRNTAPLEGNAGDCILVRAPSALPVVRTPDELAADQAAGRTWLDYALLAGGARRLYGRELGSRSWVYCAPDGSRWRCVLGGQLAQNLSIYRFGEIPGAAGAAAAVQAIVLPWAYTPPQPDAGWAAMTFGALDDVLPDGSEVIVTYGHLYSDASVVSPGATDWGVRWPYGVYRVQIEGTPPAAAATLVPVYAGTGLGRETYSYQTSSTIHGILAYRDLDDPALLYYVADTGTPPAPPPNAIQIADWRVSDGLRTGEDAYVLGGCYVDGVAHAVRLRKSYTNTVDLSWTEIDDPWPGIRVEQAVTATATVTLEIGQQQLSATASDSYVAIQLRSADGYPAQIVPAADVTMQLDGMTLSTPAAKSDYDYAVAGTPTRICEYHVMPMRLATGVWALCMVNGGALAQDIGGAAGTDRQQAGGHWHIGYITPWESVYTRVERPLTASRTSLTGYASVHPVSHQLATSWDHAVCWL